MLVAATLHLASCIYDTPLNLVFQDFYAKNVKNTTKKLSWWGLQGSNLWPYECESYALANWAKSPDYESML